MEEAKKLLSNSDYSIREITGKVGYANDSHFIRAFRSMEGVTPIQFRNMNK